MFLYHICRERDRGNLKLGYIGVTTKPKQRWKQHQKSGNLKLKNAYCRYDDIVEYIITEGTEEYCLWLEAAWRPNEMIGWNVVKGGNLPQRHIRNKNNLPTISNKHFNQEKINV